MLYQLNSFWTLSHDQKGPVKQGLSFTHSDTVLEIGSLVFFETSYGIKGPYVWQAVFLESDPLTGLFNFLGKSSHFLEMV